MKQEDKELLLKDLCARLPYGVKCESFNHVYGKNIFKVTDIRDNGYICGTINNQHCWSVFDQSELKPYLFPLSSMTNEQKRELDDMFELDLNLAKECIRNGVSNIVSSLNRIDWLNTNHFDYRGLIEKGLAIDATNMDVY